MPQVTGKCSICLGHFIPENISALPCGHTFHYGCILDWLKASSTCPQCRVTSTESGLIRQLYFSDNDASFPDSSRQVTELKEAVCRERDAHAKTIEIMHKIKEDMKQREALVIKLKERLCYGQEVRADFNEIRRCLKNVEDTLKEMYFKLEEEKKQLVASGKEQLRHEQNAHAETTESLRKVKEEKEKLAALVRELKEKSRRRAQKPLKRLSEKRDGAARTIGNFFLPLKKRENH